MFKKIKSPLLHVDYGVPQGSILGPFLFLVFINDITFSCPDAKFTLYADDTSLFLNDPCAHSLISRTNSALSCIRNWLEKNRLTLNENKTKYMFFHRRQQSVPNLEAVHLGSSIIERVDNIKFLGLVIDENLSWVLHTNHVAKILSKFAAILFKIRCQLNKAALNLVYNALVYPSILYCSSLWGFTKQCHLKK